MEIRGQTKCHFVVEDYQQTVGLYFGRRRCRRP